MNQYKIGFACKYMHDDHSLLKKDIKEIERSYNGTTTTLAYLNKLNSKDAFFKLEEVVLFNLASLKKLVMYVSGLDYPLRMLRISSDILPFYNHEKYQYVYSNRYIKDTIESELSDIGNLIRKHSIKPSMHPGQFCVLASDKPNVIKNSIAEFEYHVDMIRMMGFAQQFQDFKCNIHIAGRLGVPGMRETFSRLSKEALNVITIENDEKTYGLDDCLLLSDLCPIVFDIHHHWIKDREWFDPSDVRYQRIIDSWRGNRPTMHYSQSKEDLNICDTNILPDIDSILEKLNRKDLFAHSNMMWNDAVNNHVSLFLKDFDIMIEAKHKNLAAQSFFEYCNKLKV